MRIEIKAVLLILLTGCLTRASELYVAPDGNDASPGTAQQPFAHVERARDRIREMKQAGTLPPGGVSVVLRAGTYYLDRPLLFEPQDSGTEAQPIVYTAAENAEVTISGGRLVRGWQHVKDNLWTVQLPQVSSGEWYFRQLFNNGQRLDRARLPQTGFYRTVGPLSQYAATIKLRDFKLSQSLRTTHPDASCGFSYKPGDIQQWPDADEAEVITYHSWECSWQTIRKIDDQKHDVYFYSPCRYPVGIFTPACPYRIENIRDGLLQPGEWQLDRKTGVLSYLSRTDEDPNKETIVAPVLEKLVLFQGENKHARFVHHITLRGIRFSCTEYAMGIYDISPDWPARMQKIDPSWPSTFPPGYTDSQAAPLCGEAIELNSARDCAVERCELTNIGAYGIGIFDGSSSDRVTGCYIHDAGGGGVLVRHPTTTIAGLNKTDMPHDNVVENNTIRHISLVHPSAVGIIVGQSYGNTIRHNEISDGGYTGIHLGWTWGRTPNFTGDNLIEANDIYDVMRYVVDGAGIYSLGIETGTVYRANYVHSIHRVDIAGGPAAAYYFDEGSRDIHLERNVARDTTKILHYNHCKKQEMTWQDNYLTPIAPGAAEDPALLEVIKNAGPDASFRWPGSASAVGN
jgi:hypothetical protein